MHVFSKWFKIVQIFSLVMHICKVSPSSVGYYYVVLQFAKRNTHAHTHAHTHTHTRSRMLLKIKNKTVVSINIKCIKGMHSYKINWILLNGHGFIYWLFFQEFSIGMFLRQTWNDTRLVYDRLPRLRSLELDTRMMDKIWVPDLFIANEKSASFHLVTVPNKLMHIYPEGRIQYSVR